MVAGHVLNPVPAVLPQVQLPAVGGLRRGQRHEHQPHGIAPLIGVRPRHTGNGHRQFRPGNAADIFRHGPGTGLRHRTVFL